MGLVKSIVGCFVYKNSEHESGLRTGGRAAFRVAAFATLVLGFLGVILYSHKFEGWKGATEWMKKTNTIAGVKCPFHLVGAILMIVTPIVGLIYTKPKPHKLQVVLPQRNIPYGASVDEADGRFY